MHLLNFIGHNKRLNYFHLLFFMMYVKSTFTNYEKNVVDQLHQEGVEGSNLERKGYLS